MKLEKKMVNDKCKYDELAIKKKEQNNSLSIYQKQYKEDKCQVYIQQ